jgi:predicted kinase
MVLDDIINKENLDINWDFLEQIPEFNNLKKGGYHNQWHMEGSSWGHTKNVVEAAYNLPEWDDLTDIEKEILLYACLFHDVGKSTTNVLLEDGNYSAPYHAKTGEKMTRYLLWNLPFDKREMICSLVKYHMKPNHLFEKSENEIDRTIIEISHNSNNKLLYLLTKCDSLGAISIDRDITLTKKELLKERAIALNCFNSPFVFFNDTNKFYYFNKNKNNSSPYSQLFDNTEFTIYIMSGVMGSGKDTYITQNLGNLPIVSRDMIREELGYVDVNGKFKGNKKQENKVSEKEEEKIKEYCRNKQSFVYNNMNVKHMWRNKFINTVIPYNPRIEIIYVETSKEENILRRRGQISEDVITKVQKEMEIPYSTECYKITYILNGNRKC